MARTQDDIDNLNPVIPVKRDDGYENPWEIIDSPWGHIERWRASTLATGTMGCLAQVAAIVRNDAAELEQKTVELDAKKHAVLSTINRLVKFMSRVDELTTRVEQLEAKRRADEEQQREFEEEPIPEPPGTVCPSVAADHQPGGELHSVAPKEEPPSELPEPPLEEEFSNDLDSLGDLPEPLRDLPDPVEPPKGQVVPQPVSISLTEE